MKTYASYLIAFLLSIGIGFADTGSALQEQFESIKKMNYLNQIGVYFVNETTKATPKEYTLNINQEESKELTLLLKNDSDKDLNFRIKFADQTLTNDGTRGCGAQYDKGFSKFITVPRTGDILVSANSQMNKKITLKFPIGIEGTQKGCIAYGVTEDIKPKSGSMISIVTRKVLYLNVAIVGTEKIVYKIDIGNITKRINDKGELLIGIKVRNLGNVDSAITIQGNISNILGFERPIFASGTMLKKEEGTLTANVGQLPFYKGIFTIQITIGDKTIKILYFQAHWRMFIPLLLVITIFYKTRRKYKSRFPVV